MLRQEESWVLRVGDGSVRVAVNRAAAFKALFGLPDVAGGIGERRGGAGLDADDARRLRRSPRWRRRRNAWRGIALGIRPDRRGSARRRRRLQVCACDLQAGSVLRDLLLRQGNDQSVGGLLPLDLAIVAQQAYVGNDVAAVGRL